MLIKKENCRDVFVIMIATVIVIFLLDLVSLDLSESAFSVGCIIRDEHLS